MKWAVGKHISHAQNPTRQDSDHQIVWVQPHEIHPLVHPSFRVTPDSKENHIGNRMEKAQQHLSSGKWMDPPDIGFNKQDPRYPVGIGNGRHRIAAAQKLGATWIPASVPKEEVGELSKHINIRNEHPEIKESIIGFKEWLMERKLSVKPTFPDKITHEHLSPEELRTVKSGAFALSKGGEYNRYVLNHDQLPTSSHKDSSINRVAKAVDILFDKKKKLSLDTPAVLYHGTRHELKWNREGKDSVTSIPTLLSTTSSKKRGISFANKELSSKVGNERKRMGDREFHHVLAIHYDPERHSHIPFVNIAHHSSTSEDEVVAPPHTKFRLLDRTPEDGGTDKRTGKQVMIHHVEPVETHPLFDRKYHEKTDAEKAARLAEVRKRPLES